MSVNKYVDEIDIFVTQGLTTQTKLHQVPQSMTVTTKHWQLYAR